MLQLNNSNGKLTVKVGKFILVYPSTKYDTNFKEINNIKESYNSEIKNVKTNEQFELLNTSTFNKIKTLLGEDLDNRKKNNFSKYFNVDSQGRLFLIHRNETNNIAVPKQLAEIIKNHVDKDIDYKYLVNYWRRTLMQDLERPYQYDRTKIKNTLKYVLAPFFDQDLYDYYIEKGFTEKYAKENSITTEASITEEGYLSLYKVVEARNYLYKHDENGNVVPYKLFEKVEEKLDEISGQTIKNVEIIEHFAEDEIFMPYIIKNGDHFYCDNILGYIYKVGKHIEHREWDKIDCNDSHSCVKGLHVGRRTYNQGWIAEKAPMLEVFVCPSQIGAVVSDDVMRVKSFFAHGLIGKVPNKGFYHTSQFGAINDEEWNEIELMNI